MCHHRSPIATVLSLSTTRSPKAHDNDYYEILQISRKADFDTIRRVFRIMAARFHPDNAETGDLETFLRMKRAYAVPLRSFEMQIRCGGVSKS
jgi:preprotein translocase subunit Sec63